MDTKWPMRSPGVCKVYLCAMSMVASRIRSAEKSQSDPHWRDYLLFYEYSTATMGPASGPASKADVIRVIARLMQVHALVTSEALLTGLQRRSLQGSPTRGAINGHRAARTLISNGTAKPHGGSVSGIASAFS